MDISLSPTVCIAKVSFGQTPECGFSLQSRLEDQDTESPSNSTRKLINGRYFSK